MAYLKLEDYTAMYGVIEGTLFSRFSFEAEKIIDNHTTTLDGVKKLRVAFPTDPYSVECITHCMGILVYMMSEMFVADNTETKKIASVSSGSESISYVTGDSLIDKMRTDIGERDKAFASLVKEYLSGVTDENGVPLLYRGAYPIEL